MSIERYPDTPEGAMQLLLKDLDLPADAELKEAWVKPDPVVEGCYKVTIPRKGYGPHLVFLAYVGDHPYAPDHEDVTPAVPPWRPGAVVRKRDTAMVWATAIVKHIDESGNIHLFRPYGHSSDFAHNSGAICYVGIEEFWIPAKGAAEDYELLDEGPVARAEKRETP